jgi:signal transduction histidine kinase/CheY-like chemotaxis protein
MLNQAMSSAERRRHLGDLAIPDELSSEAWLHTEDAVPPSVPGATEPAIAELLRAKAAAEAANEAKSRYLVAVSHEIRSPLNAIYGYAQLLERGDAISGAEAGAAIRRSVDHLTSLAESLLELSHVESGVLKIQSDVVDIRALFEQIISMFRAQAIKKGLGLRLNVSNRLPALVKTDQRRLKQVLINLVSNAIKYTEAGQVEVLVDHRNEVATIDVIDTGIGIEPDDMARAFEPFERGRSTTVRSQPGIGLGLAITRVLAQVLGGEITASSTPGVGSRFRVKLMLSSVAPALEYAPGHHVEGYSGPRRTVLVIEDEPAQRAALHSLLTSLDFAVHAAGTGEEGIDLAARCSPDMVLLDVEMPGISGWETAKKLREAHGAELKILLVTARMTAPEAREPNPPAYDAMLPKPIAFDALFKAMQRLGVQWKQSAPDHTRAKSRRPTALAAELRPHLSALHRTARIGHVLEFEKQLAEMEHAVPAAASFAMTLRTHLDDFDFGAIMEKIENAGA